MFEIKSIQKKQLFKTTKHCKIYDLKALISVGIS